MSDRNPNHEYPDPTPVHIPGKSDQVRPLSLRDEMQRYIRTVLSHQAQANQVESFEDADDFEIDEEPDLTSSYTVSELTQPGLSVTLDGEPTQEDKDAARTAQPSEGGEATETPPEESQ